MTENERTRRLLTEYCQAYPELCVQDVFKFIYQSAFGCEHMVVSEEGATEYILKEYENLSEKGDCGIEELDGDYVRVPLSYMKNGLSASTFAKLFVLSAKKESDGYAKLLEKTAVALELVRRGRLPFGEKEFCSALSEWEKNSYSALHHSNSFREAYKPSYRVIAKEFAPFLPLFARVDSLLDKGRATVSVDGGSASGKTTLSSLLQKVYDCTVFHMDDFFLQPHQRTEERFAEIGGNIDYERFLSEVLVPLGSGETVKYRKFDCSSASLGEVEYVTPKNAVFVEGAYSMHPTLEKYYDLSVFLDISPKIQRQRIEKRNSPAFAKRFFEEWIPLENIYFDKTDIKKRSDLIIEIK